MMSPMPELEVPLIPDCSACIVNALKTAVPLLTDDPDAQYDLFRLAYRRISEGYEKNLTPLILSVQLYQELYTRTGVEDPFRKIKQQSTEAAQHALPAIAKKLERLEGREKLIGALSASIAGTVIDFNTGGHKPDLERLVETFDDIQKQGFAVDHSALLWKAMTEKKGQLIFLADNAGEVILDVPLLELIHSLGWNTLLVVKGRAMSNDVTREDVAGTAVEEVATIIDSGAWAHGVPKEWVSDEFLEAVRTSDLAISKGQANIESFPQIQREFGLETYYVTRAKCHHISSVLGVRPGTNVVMRKPDPD